jgi:hypothetical protein
MVLSNDLIETQPPNVIELPPRFYIAPCDIGGGSWALINRRGEVVKTYFSFYDAVARLRQIGGAHA